MEEMKNAGSNEKGFFGKMVEKAKNSRLVKHFKVHGKDYGIGAVVGVLATGTAVGVHHAVTKSKSKTVADEEPTFESTLEYDELPSETDTYLEDIEARLASDDDPVVVHEAAIISPSEEVSEE